MFDLSEYVIVLSQHRFTWCVIMPSVLDVDWQLLFSALTCDWLYSHRRCHRSVHQAFVQESWSLFLHVYRHSTDDEGNRTAGSIFHESRVEHDDDMRCVPTRSMCAPVYHWISADPSRNIDLVSVSICTLLSLASSGNKTIISVLSLSLYQW